MRQFPEGSPWTRGAQPAAVLRLRLPDGSPRTRGAQPAAVLRLAQRRLPRAFRLPRRAGRSLTLATAIEGNRVGGRADQQDRISRQVDSVRPVGGIEHEAALVGGAR